MQETLKKKYYFDWRIIVSKTFVVIAMLFMHVFDDYFLQGILANMKQRDWWVKNAPQKLYKYDYIMALIMHSISWSFMIMLPIAVYFNFQVGIGFAVVFVLNVVGHAFIDNAKANFKFINLWTDQLLHIVCQIGITTLLLKS